jgi:hypothetical protein
VNAGGCEEMTGPPVLLSRMGCDYLRLGFKSYAGIDNPLFYAQNTMMLLDENIVKAMEPSLFRLVIAVARRQRATVAGQVFIGPFHGREIILRGFTVLHDERPQVLR